MRKFPEIPRLIEVFICLLAAAASVQYAQAEPYKTSLNINPSRLQSLFSQYALRPASSGKRIRPVSELALSGHVPGLGFMKASFNRVRIKDWPSFFTSSYEVTPDRSALLLLRGNFAQRSPRRAAPELITAVAFPSGRKLRLKALFSAERATSGSRRYYSLTATISGDSRTHKAKVRRVPASVLRAHPCAGELRPQVQAALAPALSASGSDPFPVLAAESYLRAQFGLEGDYQFYQTHGSGSNVQLSATLNAAEAIYERDLGVTFSILAQNVITSSSSNYSSFNALTLLNQFSNRVNSQHHLGQADVYHLVTGKNTYYNDPDDPNDEDDYSVAGLAYVGVVCAYPQVSTGLTEDIHDSINYILLAHEVGHNFGADHDFGLPASLMYPAADPEHDFFSTFSKNQINAFLDDYGQLCLDTVSSPSETPTPSPTSNPSPTPVPGAPTATATSTPTDGGGGGGNGGGGGAVPGEDPHLPAVALNITLAANGNTSAILTLSGGILREACSSHIIISRDSGFTSTTSVPAGSGLESSAAAAFKIPFRLRPGQTGRLYLKGAYNCSDASVSGVSAVKKVNPSRVRRGKVISLSKWRSRYISRMRSAFSAT